ncbi:hypothetical protein C5C41_05100 [Rathayibacter sp. AY1E9]|uniref:hypothetical protein n=1 Tax=Rathayibacter sp. AY1E9 TaxID=2080556 RepID=UPI000CE8C398|nr:hypothetical protein [Rathayibacter sp. AY1E9]PPG54221.1 hypothetical protein C5C41_05100 [Rathayibacter sp. AY1E9]
MTEPPTVLEHVRGARTLRARPETIDDLLALNGIPRTMVQAYLERGVALTPVPGWTRLPDVPSDVNRIVVRALRNTLFETILPWGDDARTAGEGAGISGISFAEDVAVAEGALLEAERAKELVTGQVVDFVKEHGVSQRGCVFGVSGGGDSNALAFGLASGMPPDRLSAFTLVFGDVMTAAAADRASVLCQDLGIAHQVYSEDETAVLLGLRTSLPEMYDDFQHAFGEEAVHFFGTFLILRAARTIAHRHGFGDLAFGYNREDLLAELTFTLMNGRAPLAYPVRPLGHQRIIMPVWRAPKVLLDACHPRFSLENYRERDAQTTRQRSLAFYLGHSFDSTYPGFGLSVLDGASRAFTGSFSPLSHNAELDVFVTQDATQERIERVRGALLRHLPERL